MRITKSQLRRIIKEELTSEAGFNQASMNPAPKGVHSEKIAMGAADEALEFIQNRIGQEAGDVAAQWPGYDNLVSLLVDYMHFEEQYMFESRVLKGVRNSINENKKLDQEIKKIVAKYGPFIEQGGSINGAVEAALKAHSDMEPHRQALEDAMEDHYDNIMMGI